jgi:hypothetical protein
VLLGINHRKETIKLQKGFFQKESKKIRDKKTAPKTCALMKERKRKEKEKK